MILEHRLGAADLLIGKGGHSLVERRQKKCSADTVKEVSRLKGEYFLFIAGLSSALNAIMQFALLWADSFSCCQKCQVA